MHIPVLLQEVVEGLNPRSGTFFIDGTLGEGGHARALLKRLPGGSFLGIDRDAKAVERCRATLADISSEMEKVILIVGNYAQIPNFLNERSLPKADGIVLDLGFSSEEIEGQSGGKGFSFKKAEPLIMTYDQEGTPVLEILKSSTAQELTRILFEYGEERYAAKIAKAIVDGRQRSPILTTTDLVRVIETAVPEGYRHGRIHFATRTFQALRIAANKELDHLTSFLKSIPDIVADGGRVAIISFHSLEDRLVKQHFQRLEKEGGWKRITKKPLVASEEEVASNPRSRSAKLRILQRI